MRPTVLLSYCALTCDFTVCGPLLSYVLARVDQVLDTASGSTARRRPQRRLRPARAAATTRERDAFRARWAGLL